MNLCQSKEEYEKRLNSLTPYNSLQEKNAILKVMGGDVSTMEIARILGTDPINNIEASAFIFKLRENSVSDIIEINYECPTCGTIDMHGISIPEMFFSSPVDESIPVGLFEDVDEWGIEDINNLEISEYDELSDTMHKNNTAIFSPWVTLSCRICSNEKEVSISPREILSKFSIANIYEQYMDISYFSSMTKQDTDSMLPFEREIFMGLIQKKEDEKDPNKHR